MRTARRNPGTTTVSPSRLERERRLHGKRTLQPHRAPGLGRSGARLSRLVAYRAAADANRRQDHLGDFPLFSQWGNAVTSDAKVHLFDQGGQEIACTPRSAAIEPRLWPFVFPATLQVGKPSFDTFEGRKWRTFPAKAVHDAAMAVQFISFLTSPDKPPAPSTYPFTRPVFEFARLSMIPSERQASV